MNQQEFGIAMTSLIEKLAISVIEMQKITYEDLVKLAEKYPNDEDAFGVAMAEIYSRVINNIAP